jgi:ribokinase
VRFVGAVGNDEFAERTLAMLRADGVDLQAVKVMAAATQVASIFVDATGENVIAVLPGANAEMVPADADAALGELPHGAVVMLQQEITQEATARALKIARERGLVSILNTAPFIADTPRLAGEAAILVANETEFALLAGASPDVLDDAMADWARAQRQTVIVTLGAAGARAATPDAVFTAPALPVVPVDTVGAGDTFCGYLAAGLAEDMALEEAMRRAAAAASLACLKAGAQPAIPRRAEVEAALA